MVPLMRALRRLGTFCGTWIEEQQAGRKEELSAAKPDEAAKLHAGLMRQFQRHLLEIARILAGVAAVFFAPVLLGSSLRPQRLSNQRIESGPKQFGIC